MIGIRSQGLLTQESIKGCCTSHTVIPTFVGRIVLTGDLFPPDVDPVRMHVCHSEPTDTHIESADEHIEHVVISGAQHDN